MLKTKYLGIRLSSWLYKRLKQESNRTKKGASHIVREAIEKYLEKSR